MGPKISCCALLLLILLCGCTRVVERPYMYITDGVYVYGDMVEDCGLMRNRTPTDTQALQYITDDSGISLTPGELASYDGSLYSLSNYRELLLSNGYVIDSEIRTADILDTTLSFGEDKVRLIYQPSGSIRILFKNSKGAAHILLEGVQ